MTEFVRKMLKRDGYEVIQDGQTWRAIGVVHDTDDIYLTEDAAWKACRDDYYWRKEHDRD